MPRRAARRGPRNRPICLISRLRELIDEVPVPIFGQRGRPRPVVTALQHSPLVQLLEQRPDLGRGQRGRTRATIERVGDIGGVQQHHVRGAGGVEGPQHPQVVGPFLGGGEGEQAQPVGMWKLLGPDPLGSGSNPSADSVTGRRLVPLPTGSESCRVSARPIRHPATDSPGMYQPVSRPARPRPPGRTSRPDHRWARPPHRCPRWALHPWRSPASRPRGTGCPEYRPDAVRRRAA